ncbi:SIR2 family protein [Tumebacillus avium]|uniref:hypothetical protein n=1 Tax=Tumebacillus avium TaxID=1903704 RepID=UPI001E3B0729|nr:hypothetical protein [Tumebacillus avium]
MLRKFTSSDRITGIKNNFGGISMDIYIRRIADGLIKKKNKSEAGVVFFLGAGFSMRKADEVDGLGSGNELASKLCLQLDRPNTLSLERASEYFEAVFDRTDLISEVKSYIKENQTQKKSHMLLSEIINLLDEPNEIVFTTNYDTLLETAYKEKYRKDLEVWKLGSLIASIGISIRFMDAFRWNQRWYLLQRIFIMLLQKKTL